MFAVTDQVDPADGKRCFTFGEYLRFEEVAPRKHEFLAGEVRPMAGGSPEHAAVIGNITTLLSNQLRGQQCRVYATVLRVRVKATGLGTYPDISVVGGHLECDPEDRSGHTVINPRVIVEVLSPMTETYDRGEKPATPRAGRCGRKDQRPCGFLPGRS